MMARTAQTFETAEERYVAFIDILGFKDLVRRWLTDRSLAQHVEATITRAITWVGGEAALRPAPLEEWHLKIFSDCFVISQPADDLGLFNLLEGVSYFQREMLASGYAVRGAISVGVHYEGRVVTLSPTLAEAYQLESSRAVYPRILLAPKVVKAIELVEDTALADELRELIVVDEDGLPFVCHFIFQEDDPWLMGHRFYLLHCQMIQAVLDDFATPTEVRAKYDWLGAFHNWNLQVAAAWLSRHGAMAEDELWNFGALRVNRYGRQYTFRSLAWTAKVIEEMRELFPDDSLRHLRDRDGRIFDWACAAGQG